MSISFRVVMVLVCAYAGWETARLQFGELPDPQQLAQKNSSPCRHEHLNANEESKAQRLKVPRNPVIFSEGRHRQVAE